MVENRNNKRIIHAAIALLIALILIFANSASAVTVKVNTDNMPTTVGQTGHFYFNVTIGGNEKIPIANFTIEDLPKIDGSPNGILSFSVSNTTVGSYIKEGNYKIELVNIYGWVGSSNNSYGNSTNYGYDRSFAGYGYGYAFSGYGYGYGSSNQNDTRYTQIAYKITVDTTGAAADTYDVTGKINTGVSSKPYFSTASTSSFTLKAEESTRRSSSSSSRSNYWKYHGTPTPTTTESIDATQDQTQPGQTQTEQVTSTPTPVTTEEQTEDGPGFGAVMFIAGLLAAAYIIMRKRG